MTIAFGRRRLILSLIVAPPGPKLVDLPMAQNATDDELARLNSTISAMEDRRRWEASAILYGGMRPR
ncbi:MAG: hypothetical protein QOF01_472 [Thermomicrobiales bacterium]|jgi:hypothetical protein|nr:hypothetical protein [Thermomicrobiales bacterium]